MSDNLFLIDFFLSLTCYCRGFCHYVMTNKLGVRRHNATLTLSKVGSLCILCEIPTVLINLDWLSINNDSNILNESF